MNGFINAVVIACVLAWSEGQYVATGTGVTTDNRPVVTIYTGERVYGQGWCYRCNWLKPIYGNGDSRVRVVWSTDPVPDGMFGYPAIRFRNADNKLCYTADKTTLEYRIPVDLDELTRIVLANTKKDN